MKYNVTCFSDRNATQKVKIGNNGRISVIVKKENICSVEKFWKDLGDLAFTNAKYNLSYLSEKAGSEVSDNFVKRDVSYCPSNNIITGKRQITAPSVFSDDSLLSTKRNKTILENQRRSDDPKDLISKTQLSTKEYICYLQAVLKDFPRLTVLQIAIDKLNALLETTTVQEAKIQEQSEAISEQNLVIEDLQRNLQRVKDLMSKHKKDCEAGKALTTQEFEAFQLLQELSLELIDSFEDDEDADDDDDDEREDSLEMDIVQPDLLTNPNLSTQTTTPPSTSNKQS